MWTGSKIKTLRLKLGWSIMDLSRRLSCKNDLVYAWEADESAPDIEVQHQLSYLELQLLDQSQKVAKGVVAETLIKDHGLAQVDLDDLKE
ncbi:MAG: helix-turn-helix transcriptional regulator [Bdellovibrionaceae bacterium]|jgi:ribosome-binding protein aMBF1 (putative translation factor)|nr:helix-turn-helix transcriptional regulator [Pseudobdellovibrionaceae bacterium]